MMCSLKIDGEEYFIGSAAIESLVGSTPDHIANTKMFAALAKHPSSSVRQAVAYKDKINTETAMLLSLDTDLEVLRSIARNEAFKKNASEEDLKRLIKIGDRNLSQTIASNIEGYENCEYNPIVDLILASADPSIRLSLAENYGTPKRILNKMANDPDPDVRNAATRDR